MTRNVYFSLNEILNPISEKLICKLTLEKDFSAYSCKELCDVLEFEYPSKDSVDPLEALKNAITSSLVPKNIAKIFIDLFSIPYVKIKDNYPTPSLETPSKKILNYEYTLTLNKIIDGVFLRILNSSIIGICANYPGSENTIYGQSTTKFANDFFFSGWPEFTRMLNDTIPGAYNVLDKLFLDRIDFKNLRYKIPKATAIWEFYRFLEMYPFISIQDNQIQLSKPYSSIIRPKEGPNLEEDRLKKLKLFMRSLQNFKSNYIFCNKSLCLDIFNEHTILVDMYLLSLETEFFGTIPTKMTYRRGGKETVRNDYRKSKRSDKIFKKIDSLALGCLTFLKPTGLKHRLLCGKNRNEYIFDSKPLSAMHLLTDYLYWLSYKYVYEQLPSYEKSYLIEKHIGIYNYFKSYEPDIDIIDGLNSKLKSHKKFDMEKFKYAYSYFCRQKKSNIRPFKI